MGKHMCVGSRMCVEEDTCVWGDTCAWGDICVWEDTCTCVCGKHIKKRHTYGEGGGGRLRLSTTRWDLPQPDGT